MADSLLASLEAVLVKHGLSKATIGSIKSSPALQYYASLSTPPTVGQEVRETVIEQAKSEGMDAAADFCIQTLAKALDVDDWQQADGSETWDGDVAGTIYNVLVAARVYDDEDGRVARLDPALSSPPQAVTCAGCEGRPTPENNPCAVCGKQAVTSQSVGQGTGGPCYCWCHPNAGAIGCSPCCDAEDNYLPPSKRRAALAEPASPPPVGEQGAVAWSDEAIAFVRELTDNFYRETPRISSDSHDEVNFAHWLIENGLLSTTERGRG
ncbi:hypothetical protein [Sphingobium bisphenolivorans]|uniref:hypothetical protein n=1 Tax=Sphingobium bisphenolivorans TaxID=1335760 RepID=UPI00047FDCC0|nr:hypothetical protein [Sphingobium bisphenolivorans]